MQQSYYQKKKKKTFVVGPQLVVTLPCAKWIGNLSFLYE